MLAVVTVVGLIGFNFNTLVPLLASDTLHVDARAFGLLSAAFGLGRVRRGARNGVVPGAHLRAFTCGTLGFSVLLLALAPVHDARLAGALLFGIGAWFTLFAANANALVQLAAPDHTPAVAQRAVFTCQYPPPALRRYRWRPSLLLAVVAGAFYPDKPAALWATLLGDKGGLSLLEHASIAVLPFDDLSADSRPALPGRWDCRRVDHGVGQVPDLIVMARNSAFTYKDKPTDVRQVGKDLNVRYVVEGSITRSDQNVRVTAQLIDATTGSHIWADRYDRSLNNIFEIRDDIMQSIAGTLGGLQGKVAKAEIARVSEKDPNSFTAYDYVMRGWYEWYKLTREGNAAARDLFEQATKIDPNYARAYAGLAWTYSSDYDFEWTDDFDKTLKPRARECEHGSAP